MIYYVELGKGNIVHSAVCGSDDFVNTSPSQYIVTKQVYEAILTSSVSLAYDPITETLAVAMDMTAKKAQILSILREKCRAAIVNGFVFHNHWFNCTPTDQINYTRYHTMRNALATIDIKDRNGVMVRLSSVEMSDFIAALHAHVTNKQECYNKYKLQISALEGVNETKLEALLREAIHNLGL